MISDISDIDYLDRNAEQADRIQLVRQRREQAAQTLWFAVVVLCGLPVCPISRAAVVNNRSLARATPVST
jgi:hypothetical protein